MDFALTVSCYNADAEGSLGMFDDVVPDRLATFGEPLACRGREVEGHFLEHVRLRSEVGLEALNAIDHVV